jgi:hypothetical protein
MTYWLIGLTLEVNDDDDDDDDNDNCYMGICVISIARSRELFMIDVSWISL